MKEPVSDITLLLLLILFFGVQQRRRPQEYFRYWMVGWILVVAAYLSWMIVVQNPLLIKLEDVAKTDLLFVGLLTFLISFLRREKEHWRTLLRGSAIGLPLLLVVNGEPYFPPSRVLFCVVIVIWHATGIWAARRLVSQAEPRKRLVLQAFCVLSGVVALIYLQTCKQQFYLDGLALAEVLISTALLYWTGPAKRTLATWVGTGGFLLWATSYLLSYFPTLHGRAAELVGMFWNFPKYFVGFSMILKVFEDASAEKSKLVEQYRRLYEDFRLMFESHVHSMWICEPETYRFLSANTAAILQYGYSETDFKRMTLEDLSADPDGWELGDDATLQQHRRKDRSCFWVEITTSWVGFQGKDAHFVMARDATQEKLQNDDLFYRANHDVLTGLPNRSMLADRIRQCEKRCRQDGSRMILATIDIDHFKRVNDAFGHLAGDECLKAVASRLKRGIRDVDMLARTGGEEFTAVIGGMRSSEDIEKVAAGILQKFESPLEFNGQSLPVTVSIGVAIYPDDATSVAALSQLSDEALYTAKRGGRNRAAFAGSLHTGG